MQVSVCVCVCKYGGIICFWEIGKTKLIDSLCVRNCNWPINDWPQAKKRCEFEASLAKYLLFFSSRMCARQPVPKFNAVNDKRATWYWIFVFFFVHFIFRWQWSTWKIQFWNVVFSLLFMLKNCTMHFSSWHHFRFRSTELVCEGNDSQHCMDMRWKKNHHFPHLCYWGGLILVLIKNRVSPFEIKKWKQHLAYRRIVGNTLTHHEGKVEMLLSISETIFAC
jgi:hypothetical protein